VVDVDGSDVEGPKALCELQGYVYDAWRRTAEIFEALGKQDAAQSLRTKANVLYDRFNEAFGMKAYQEGDTSRREVLKGDRSYVTHRSYSTGRYLHAGG